VKLIHTRRGMGYMLSPSPDASGPQQADQGEQTDSSDSSDQAENP